MKVLLYSVLVLVVSSFVFADSTFVCSQQGDWDRWNVPSAIQLEMVNAGWTMTIVQSMDGLTSVYTVSIKDSLNNNLNVAKPSSSCTEYCKESDYDNDTCPCLWIRMPSDALALNAFIKHITGVLLN